MNNIDFLEEQAVDCAVNLEWQKAIELNGQILEQDEKNIAAYLRLGYAHMQLGNIQEAQSNYKSVLKIQSKNHIALSNLDKLSILADKYKGVAIHGKDETEKLDPDLFLETPGKTKAVQLVNIGQKDDIASLVVGQHVDLNSKKRKIEVRTKSGQFLGYLPDDLSRRMFYLLQEGNIYKAYIKEVSLSCVTIFIREVEKANNVKHLVSFPQNTQMNIPQNQNNKSKDSDAEEYEDEDDLEDIEADDPDNTLTEEVDKDILRYKESQDDDEESEE